MLYSLVPTCDRLRNSSWWYASDSELSTVARFLVLLSSGSGYVVDGVWYLNNASPWAMVALSSSFWAGSSNTSQNGTFRNSFTCSSVIRGMRFSSLVVVAHSAMTIAIGVMLYRIIWYLGVGDFGCLFVAGMFYVINFGWVPCFSDF